MHFYQSSILLLYICFLSPLLSHIRYVSLRYIAIPQKEEVKSKKSKRYDTHKDIESNPSFSSLSLSLTIYLSIYYTASHRISHLASRIASLHRAVIRNPFGQLINRYHTAIIQQQISDIISIPTATGEFLYSIVPYRTVRYSILIYLCLSSYTRTFHVMS